MLRGAEFEVALALLLFVGAWAVLSTHPLATDEFYPFVIPQRFRSNKLGNASTVFVFAVATIYGMALGFSGGGLRHTVLVVGFVATAAMLIYYLFLLRKVFPPKS